MKASYSKLKLLKIAPCMVLQEHESTTNQLFGTLCHEYILNNTNFYNNYAILDDSFIINDIGGKSPKATNKYKDFLNNFIAENPTKQIVTLDELNILKELYNNVWSSDIFTQIAENAIFETKLEFTLNNIECTGIPDLVNVDKKIILELKTTQNASKSNFAKQISNFDYHLQAAMYIYACSIIYGGSIDEWSFVFLAIETKEPYLLNYYTLDNQSIAYGRHMVDMLLCLWAECLKTGFDKGYSIFNSEKIEKIGLPAYKYNENFDYYI